MLLFFALPRGRRFFVRSRQGLKKYGFTSVVGITTSMVSLQVWREESKDFLATK
jgi:hypothetical protein